MFPGETVLSRKALGEEPDEHISDFQVMESGAEWYIGTMFLACGNPDCKECSEYAFGRTLTKGQPLDHNSRETDYVDSKEKAEAILKEFERTGHMLKQRA